MVDLEKDTHFKKCMTEIDDFIQELHEENKKIRELRQQNNMLVEEIQKPQNEVREKNSAADSENKTESDIRFERRMKNLDMLLYILWAEIGILIGLDIVLFINIFSKLI